MTMNEQLQPAELDQVRQQKAKAYARVRRRFAFLDMVLGAGYLVLWLAAGWHDALRQYIDGITSSPALAVILYAVVLGVPYFLIDLPLSYYTGYTLPHRYGQSNQTRANWFADLLKSLLIAAVLGAVVLQVLYWLLRISPDMWWLFTGGVLLVFTVLLSTLAPVLIAPLFYKFIPLDNEDLNHRLLDLADRAGTRVQGVFRFDMSTRTKSANAAVMGLGATRRIVLGDTLLEEFSADEIETVLAHELAHIIHRDVPLLVAFSSVLTLLSLWIAHLALSWGTDYFRLESISDPAGLPVLLLTIGVVSFIASPVSNAFSRWRERMADQYALAMTGKPTAFASAMKRLANQNLGDADPERWVVILFYSHPPIKERVAAAEAFSLT